MARGRMLDKSLSTSRKFAAVAAAAGELGEFCQALYPLLVAHADDFGRLSGDACTVKWRCHPTSPRDLAAFDEALTALHDVRLLTRYEVAGNLFLEIADWERHQTGLHKRTASKYPDCPPRPLPAHGSHSILPPIPDDSGNVSGIPTLREEKGTEQKRTGTGTGTGTEPRPMGAALPPLTARSKRPVFTGQRLTVFEWQWADCDQTLGPLAVAFDLHAWFFALDAHAVETGLVIPKRDGGAWLQAQLLAECQRRGLPLRLAHAGPDPQQARDDLTRTVAAKLGITLAAP